MIDKFPPEISQPGISTIARGAADESTRRLEQLKDGVVARIRHSQSRAVYAIGFGIADVRTSQGRDALEQIDAVTLQNSQIHQPDNLLPIGADVSEGSSLFYLNPRFSSVRSAQNGLAIEQDFATATSTTTLAIPAPFDVSGHAVVNPRIQYRMQGPTAEYPRGAMMATLSETPTLNQQLQALAIYLCEAQGTSPNLEGRPELVEKLIAKFGEIQQLIDRFDPLAKEAMLREARAREENARRAMRLAELAKLREQVAWCEDPYGQAALLVSLEELKSMGLPAQYITPEAQMDIASYNATIAELLGKEYFQKAWNRALLLMRQRRAYLSDYDESRRRELANGFNEIITQDVMFSLTNEKFPGFNWNNIGANPPDVLRNRSRLGREVSLFFNSSLALAASLEMCRTMNLTNPFPFSETTVVRSFLADARGDRTSLLTNHLGNPAHLGIFDTDVYPKMVAKLRDDESLISGADPVELTKVRQNLRYVR